MFHAWTRTWIQTPNSSKIQCWAVLSRNDGMIAQMQQATENKTTLAQIVNRSSARRPIFKPIAVDLDLDSTHAKEREQYIKHCDSNN